MVNKRAQLYANDEVWAMFYRDGKSLGQIANHFGATVYDLTPWLTAPISQVIQQRNKADEPSK